MPTSASSVICIALFSGMFALLVGGMEIGRRSRSELDSERTSMLEGAVFALLGLLLGFAFAGAMSRLDTRRELIAREAHAIGAAYQRIDLLPAHRQDSLRGLFRDYLASRVQTYESMEAGQDPTPAILAAARLQRRIWVEAVAAQQESDTTTTLSVLNAIQDMTGEMTARAVVRQTYTPGLILALPLGAALLSALVAGYTIARPGWRTMLRGAAFAAAVSGTVYVILDLDDPRRGLIHLDQADEVLHELHGSM